MTIVRNFQGSEVPPAEREERRLRLLLQDQETEKKALEEEALTIQRHLLEAREARDDLVQKTTRLQQGASLALHLTLPLSEALCITRYH